MYTLVIKTQNEECIKFLNKSFTFEKQYYCNEEESEVFEIYFNNLEMVKSAESEFKILLADFDDTDVSYYEQADDYKEEFYDPYEENGVKPEDFY